MHNQNQLKCYATAFPSALLQDNNNSNNKTEGKKGANVKFTTSHIHSATQPYTEN